METRRYNPTLLFVLALLFWLNWGTGNQPDVATEDGFSHVLKSLNRTVTPSLYPQNITDWYKGSWNMPKRDVGPRSHWLSSSSGTILLLLTPISQPSPDITLISGEMEIRDGEYVTDTSWRPKVQGIYFWATGALYLMANPSGAYAGLDNTLVLPEGVSYTAADLWNAQVKPDKYPINPFLKPEQEGQKLQAFPRLHTINDTQNSSVASAKKEDFDHCALQLFGQVAKTSTLRSEATSLRVWRYLRHIPFDASEDDDESSDSLPDDEARLVYQMSGVVVSPNCNVMLELNQTRSVDYDGLISSGRTYIFFAILNILALSYLVISHIESRKSNSAMMKVSMTALVTQVSYDVLCSLFHMSLAFSYYPLSRPFFFVTFVAFVLYAFFQVRYLIDVWKVTTFTISLPIGGLTFIYGWVYAFLLISILVFNIDESLFWLPLLISSSTWLAQIAHNALNRTRHAWDWHIVIGTTLCRLFGPCYFYLVSRPFFHVPPHPVTILVLILWSVLQIAVLFGQDVWGPRFFIPSWLLPPVYNYHRPVPLSLLQQALAEHHPLNCVICMSEVNPDNTEHMIAPCDHVFHETCLLRWMDQKMECPVCRGRLPVPPELEGEDNIIHRLQQAGDVV